MEMQHAVTWIAFAKSRRLAVGTPREVATAVKAFANDNPQQILLVFDAHSSRQVELDLRGSLADVLRRLPAAPAAQPDERLAAESPVVRGPGRPKLGVVPREVTLLPRHWDWLASQPGGASVALRKLVEHALRANRAADQAREVKDAVYRFMHAMAGDAPDFEEASRALFADDAAALEARMAKWPRDVRKHVLALLAPTDARTAASPGGGHTGP
jgi:hypothetical protein